MAQADIIKLHRCSGKVTFMINDNFDGSPLPELRQRVKVNLRNRWVQVFAHSNEGQLLYFKERFVSSGHRRIAEMQDFSAKLRRLGIGDKTVLGPTRAELNQILGRYGLNQNLNRRREGLRSSKIQSNR